MQNNAYVIEVNEENFNEAVVEKSMEVPVLVDFWAPWCGPCKTLGPMLEKLAAEYAGAFVLAKVNSDEAQQLAAYFQIRSIPDCKLIKGGRIVDEFTGALPEGQLRAFLNKHLVSEGEQLRQAALEAQGEDKERLLRQAQAIEPQNVAIALDLADCLLANGDFDDVEALLEIIPPAKRDARHAALQARLAFAQQPPLEGNEADWLEKIQRDPKDFEARFGLAEYRVRAGDFESAFDLLLDVVMRDRADARERARLKLIEWYAVCPDAALVSRSRRQLATALN